MAETGWITVERAAALGGYHPDHIRDLLAAGKIKGKKWGWQWMVSRISLMAYVRAKEKQGQERGPKPKGGP